MATATSDDRLDVPPDAAAWGHQMGCGADGNEVHFTRLGAGRAVVLLHGWPGFWYDWRRVLGPLSSIADAIAFDFRGFGNSPLPAGSPEQVSGEQPLADDVAQVLDDLRLSGCIVVAFDLGAAVAQSLARRRRDLVAALVLLNPTHPAIGDRRTEVALRGEFWYQQLHQYAWAPSLIARDRTSIDIYLRHFYSHWTHRNHMLRPYEFDRIVDAYARPGAFEASIAWYRARPHDRALASACEPAQLRVEQPTRVLWADKDPIAPSAWAEDITKFLPNAAVSTVRDVGHFLAWEHPTAVLNAVQLSLDGCA